MNITDVYHPWRHFRKSNLQKQGFRRYLSLSEHKRHWIKSDPAQEDDSTPKIKVYKHKIKYMAIKTYKFGKQLTQDRKNCER